MNIFTLHKFKFCHNYVFLGFVPLDGPQQPLHFELIIQISDTSRGFFVHNGSKLTVSHCLLKNCLESKECFLNANFGIKPQN